MLRLLSACRGELDATVLDAMDTVLHELEMLLRAHPTLHARLYQVEGGTMVEDIGSTNGSYLNGGRLVGALPITKGDRLQIGSTVLEAQ